MTFNDRKAARIAQQKAEAEKKYKWRVVCTSFYLPPSVDPVLPGLFATKKDAEIFAYGQIGPIVGLSAAVAAMNARLFESKMIRLPDCAGPSHFAVERIEVSNA